MVPNGIGQTIMFEYVKLHDPQLCPSNVTADYSYQKEFGNKNHHPVFLTHCYFSHLHESFHPDLVYDNVMLQDCKAT